MRNADWRIALLRTVRATGLALLVCVAAATGSSRAEGNATNVDIGQEATVVVVTGTLAERIRALATEVHQLELALPGLEVEQRAAELALNAAQQAVTDAGDDATEEQKAKLMEAQKKKQEADKALTEHKKNLEEKKLVLDELRGLLVDKPEDPLLQNAYEILSETRRPAAEEDGINFSGFVTERIDLHYFTNVPLLMQCLNPASYNIDPRQSKLKLISDARKELADLDLQVQAARTGMSESARKYRSLSELKDSQRAVLVSAVNKENADRKSQLQDHPEEAANKPAADAGKRELTAVQDLNDFDKAISSPDGSAGDADTRQLGKDLKSAGEDLQNRINDLQELEGQRTQAAVIENLGYAYAHDNAPFWVAVPRVATDMEGVKANTDPIDQVFIFGFPGANYIIVRGKPDDILHVRQMVSRFDEDATQARLTLWAIELNTDATQKGAERMNEAFAIIDEEFSLTRQQIALATSLFVDTVVNRVHACATYPDEYTSASQRIDVRQDGFFSTELQDGYFLAPPDPANITTVGEALLITSLARPKQRKWIIDDFEGKVRLLICQYGLDCSGVDICFNRLRRALNADAIDFESSFSGPGINDPLDGKQILLARAISGSSRDMAAIEIMSGAMAETERIQKEAESSYAMDSFESTMKKELESRLKKVKDVADTKLKLLLAEERLSPAVAHASSSFVKTEISLLWQDDAFSMIKALGNSTPRNAMIALEQRVQELDSTNVAKANELLKEFNIAMEDDLNQLFVQPMLLRVRERILSEKVGFGVVQRTSVLATDRDYSRIDPRTTATLEYGHSINYLDELNQAVALGEGLIGQDLAVGLGLLGGTTPLDSGLSTSVSLGGGSSFEVTPIFDRTGQAVRYRLNHVYINSIRNSDGSVLPHFERTSISTTVQTSNYEIREIGRYETTYSIGKHEKKTGGLPLIRHDPVVRDMPFLGYFNLSEGSNSVLQENILFAQSIVYSSINDIRNLFILGAYR